jgi:hypothetical protein
MSTSNISVGTKIWAEKINGAWKRSIAEVFQVGVLLLQAKEAVPHGDFEDLIKTKLEFSPATARKLMAVAADERIAKRAQGAILPEHWTTLYELTKLDDAQFEQALKDGTINPDMERKDVPKKPERAAVSDPKPKPPEAHGNAQASDGAGNFGETNARQSAPAVAQPGPARQETPENQVHAGGAGGSPAADRVIAAIRRTVVGRHMSDGNLVLLAYAVTKALPEPPPHEGWIAFWVDPDDPVSWFANGLAMAIQADRVLSPKEFARCWPVAVRLRCEELNKFCDWLLDFESEYRAQYAALQAAE